MLTSFLKNKVIVFILLIVGWSILYLPEYAIYRILPIVRMGERSWPLYFFLVDTFALFTAGFFAFLLISKCWKNGRFSVRGLLWLLLGLLLFYPLYMVYISYNDLTAKLCKR